MVVSKSRKVAYLITSFNEEKTIGKAVSSAMAQDTKEKYVVYVSAPDKGTLAVVRKLQKKFSNLKILNDPGKGKSYALNEAFKKINADILILTDGDVFVNRFAVSSILREFDDSSVGCVSGRPVPVEDRKSKYGYWANFLFNAAHNMRLRSLRKNGFLECSGYLFAFRKSLLKGDIPVDVAEDTVVPHLLFNDGHKISYAPRAEVYVRNVDNFADWFSQKLRTAKAHDKISFYVDTSASRKSKSFKNEFLQGVALMVSYPRRFIEFVWTFELAFARLYMWFRVHADRFFSRDKYSDGWKRIESTK